MGTKRRGYKPRLQDQGTLPIVGALCKRAFFLLNGSWLSARKKWRRGLILWQIQLESLGENGWRLSVRKKMKTMLTFCQNAIIIRGREQLSAVGKKKMELGV